MMSAGSLKHWVIGVGYLGSRLVAALRARGHAVLGIDCTDAGDVVGDAADARFLSSMITLYGAPARVYLCQATSGGDVEAYSHSYAAVLAAVQSVLPEAELIFCSSSSLYGGQGGELVSEGSPLRAGGERAAILQGVEQIVLHACGRVARLAALYGRGRSVLLPRYLSGMVPLSGAPERWLNYVHVDDVVSALLLLPDCAAGLYNVSAQSLQKVELMALMQRVTGLPLPTQEPPSSKRGGSNQQLCSRKLRHLSWCPQHDLSSFLEQEMLHAQDR